MMLFAEGEDLDAMLEDMVAKGWIEIVPMANGEDGYRITPLGEKMLAEQNGQIQ